MLKDLLFVLYFLKQTLEAVGLVAVYTNFTNTLQQISASSTPELQKQLEDYKEEIKVAHESLEPEGWTFPPLQIFERFGAKEIVGKNGFTNFQNALIENAANTPGAILAINLQKDNIIKLLSNTTNILSSLGGLVTETMLDEDKTVIQIVFDEKVAINNITELSKLSNEWNSIIRAYSLLAKTSPEHTKIIAASKSNPFSLILSTSPIISKAIYFTIKPFLDIWNEVLKLKMNALSLESMKLDLHKKKYDLYKDIDEYERKKITETIETVTATYHANKMIEAEINEAKVALISAGFDLYKFLTDGGKVDTNKEGEKSSTSDKLQLEPAYHNIHLLKVEVQKLIESKKAKKIPKTKIKKKYEKKKKNKKSVKPVSEPVAKEVKTETTDINPKSQ